MGNVMDNVTGNVMGKKFEWVILEDGYSIRYVTPDGPKELMIIKVEQMEDTAEKMVEDFTNAANNAYELGRAEESQRRKDNNKFGGLYSHSKSQLP